VIFCNPKIDEWQQLGNDFGAYLFQGRETLLERTPRFRQRKNLRKSERVGRSAKPAEFLRALPVENTQ